MFLSSANPQWIHWRCIFPSGLYLVVHQLSALHSYAPHKPKSHRGSPPRVGFCWAEAHTNPASASFPSLGHSPGLLAVPSLLWAHSPWFGQEFKEQEPPALFCLSRCCWSGGQRSCVRPTEDSVCLRARWLSSSLPGTPEAGPMLELFHVHYRSFLTPTNSEGYHSTSVHIVSWWNLVWSPHSGPSSWSALLSGFFLNWKTSKHSWNLWSCGYCWLFHSTSLHLWESMGWYPAPWKPTAMGTLSCERKLCFLCALLNEGMIWEILRSCG